MHEADSVKYLGDYEMRRIFIPISQFASDADPGNAASGHEPSSLRSCFLVTNGQYRALMYPMAPIGSEIIKRAAYSPWSTSTTKPTTTVVARMTRKKATLNTHWTPTRTPQLVHRTSDRISPTTETESLKQFGHILFKENSPLGTSTVWFRPAAEIIAQAH